MLHSTPPPGFESRFTVVGACLEKDGKVLLLKRAAHKPQGGTWCLPAGKSEAGEDPEEALVREVYEETGITLDKGRLGPPRTWYVVWPDSSFVWTVFRVGMDGDELITLRADEHEAYQWATPREALDIELIEDQDETFIQLYGLNS